MNILELTLGYWQEEHVGCGRLNQNYCILLSLLYSPLF